MNRTTSLLIALASLTACGKTSGEDVTFYADVQPVIQQHCVRCHTAGGTGSGDFTNPDTVLAYSNAIKAQLEAGTMPPPASDPECNDYYGSEYMVMSDASKQKIYDWIDGGLELGDPSEAVEVESPETELVDWDAEVRLEGYAPTFGDAANPGNEYRCFALDPGFDNKTYITALAPVVDQTSLVHHIVVYKMDVDDVPAAALTKDGVDCIDMTDLGDGMIAGWAPGMTPVRLPEGYGLKVNPDERIIIQMHYFDNADTDGLVDKSGYRFETTSTVDREMLMFPFGTYNWTIPAGDEAFTHKESFNWNEGISVSVWASFPHMHVLGSGYDFSLEKPDGSEECVTRSENYDFNNQLTYMFKEPVVLEDGDKVNISCTWNNSESNDSLIHSPPQATQYGERTDEEMCYQFVMVSVGAP